jgi:cysteinyl-tRNA synthetase
MLKIYNSLTGRKEVFKPITPKKVGIYVCGITVYDECHIGHARTLILFDVVVRYLKFLGFNVIYVRNITDIDDKIIARANANQEPVDALTARMIASMHKDFDQLGLLIPQKEPRATKHIADIVKLIKKIMDNGYAYVTSTGDVCFDVRRYKAYGQLSHHNLDELNAGARIEKDVNKKDPLDFVLWKSAKAGEPFWPSPWGNGRPGWHIECSAMAKSVLGQPFDIHGGGLDLKFPHHENEVAQSESAEDCPFARYWMHVGLLQRDNRKMSKSLKNFFTIKEVLGMYSAEVIRYFMITGQYRSQLQYSDDNLKNAQLSLTRLYVSLRSATIDSASAFDQSYVSRFQEAMNDDFNTPKALAILFELSHQLNACLQESKKAASLAYTLKSLGNILGILYQDPDEFLQGTKVDSALVEQLISERNLARKAKDFKKADSIRHQLDQMGIIIEDSIEGTSWRLK